MLVALKNNAVVSFEQNGKIDLDVDHDRVIKVGDTQRLELGWFYTPPPRDEDKFICFFPPAPIEDPNPPADLGVAYAVDTAGNQYALSEEEKQAIEDGTWTPRDPA